MTQKQLFKKIRSRHLTGFRRFLQLSGSGSCVADYIGMNAWELREYIESQWLSGMNWENYGREWVVDHIVALKYFDPTNQKDMKLCWHYSNLKPNFFWHNHAKGYCIDVTKKTLLGLKNTPYVSALLSFISDKEKMFEPYYSSQKTG